MIQIGSLAYKRRAVARITLRGGGMGTTCGSELHLLSLDLFLLRVFRDAASPLLFGSAIQASAGPARCAAPTATLLLLLSGTSPGTTQ